MEIRTPKRHTKRPGGPRALAWGVVLLALLGGTAAADDGPDAPPTARRERRILALGEETLELLLPALKDLDADVFGPKFQVRLRVFGGLGPARLEMRVRAYPRLRYGMYEPVDVLAFAEENRWSDEDAGGGGPAPANVERFLLEGRYGWAPYLAVAKRRFTTSDGVGLIVLAGGLLRGHAYALDLTLPGNVDEAVEAAVDDFLAHGVTSPLQPWVREWSDEEVEERWEKDAPGVELRRVIRTKHYIVMTNSSGGKLFSRKMEENYEFIREMLPFEEVPNARLMPVLLFRLPDEYFAFYHRIAGKPMHLVTRSKGHAWKDYYATYYESPNDPVHIHEAVHQLVKGRLQLSGGGSWYQEGLAVYIENKKHQWNLVKVWAKQAARRGGYVPLANFIKIRSLLDVSAEGGDDRYNQAASLVAFLRESKFKPEKFDEFLQLIGKTPRRAHKELKATLESIYGVTLEELEAEWLAWWKRGGR